MKSLGSRMKDYLHSQRPYRGQEDPGGAVWRPRWIVDKDIPIFTKDRFYIERWINSEEGEG